MGVWTCDSNDLWLKQPLEVCSSVEVFHITQPRFLYDPFSSLQGDCLRNEQVLVQPLQISPGRQAVVSDTKNGIVGAVCKEDGEDTGKNVIIQIISLQRPFSQQNCGCVIPKTNLYVYIANTLTIITLSNGSYFK